MTYLVKETIVLNLKRSRGGRGGHEVLESPNWLEPQAERWTPNLFIILASRAVAGVHAVEVVACGSNRRAHAPDLLLSAQPSESSKRESSVSTKNRRPQLRGELCGREGV